MSDWLGVWDFSGVAPDATVALEPSLERLGLTRRKSTQSSEVAAVGFATTGFEQRLHFAHDAERFAFVAGNLDSPELNSARHVLEQYRRWGDSFAAHLQGTFAVLLCDSLARKLVLARDAVGTMPIYYTAVGNGVRFATRVAPLLEQGARRQPNLGALAELFIGGRWFGASETLYAGVSVLPPGHMLILDANGLRVRRHWEFPGYELLLDDPEAYRAEFRRLLIHAVNRQLGARGTAVS